MYKLTLKISNVKFSNIFRILCLCLLESCFFLFFSKTKSDNHFGGQSFLFGSVRNSSRRISSIFLTARVDNFNVTLSACHVYIEEIQFIMTVKLDFPSCLISDIPPAYTNIPLWHCLYYFTHTLNWV